VGSRSAIVSVPVFLTLAILPDATAIATCPTCHVAIDRRVAL
jgi:hypothetical protein